MPHVFGNFQEAFSKQRKGKGHETSDLGRLLDMYERWQLRLFPHCDFDTFIARVAGLHGRPGGKVTKGASLKVRTFAHTTPCMHHCSSLIAMWCRVCASTASVLMRSL